MFLLSARKSIFKIVVLISAWKVISGMGRFYLNLSASRQVGLSKVFGGDLIKNDRFSVCQGEIQ